MNDFIKIAAFLSIIICFSCEGKEWIVNCSDCQENEPENAIIKIKLKNIDTPVSVQIYEGELDDDIIYASYEANGSDFTALAGLNKKYTFTATYVIDGKTYIAVNSTTPRVKYAESDCENPCYFVYNNIVDLRLKYTAIGE
jgi:hypothetical protein